jgi:uroporphyrinogen decarboxylase
MATAKRITLDEFHAFGELYDLPLLEAIHSAKPEFIFFHVHGMDIYFDAVLKYPVQVINWHDRRTLPTLKDARGKWKGALAGGISEWDTLAAKPREAVVAQARDAIVQTGGRGFILAPGCVIPVDAPEENIRAVIETARSKAT